MAVEAAAGPMQGKLVVRNIGLLLSGDLAKPILDADTIVAIDGRITAIGKAKSVDTDKPDLVIDAKGCAVAPGLIDSHCHPVFGDWTPRQNQLGWIESCVNGGVTTFVSAGEVHLPGRPKDPIGVKALAITAQRTFANFRPSGAKIIAGAPIPEKTMGEEDYAEMAQGRRHHDRRDRPRHRQHRAGGGKARRLVPQARPADHHPHRRAVDPRLQPHQPRGGAGGESRRRQPHQRRSHRARHRPHLPAVRASEGRHRDRPQRQRASGHHGAEDAPSS